MLPAFDANERSRQRTRWNEAEDVKNKILARIRAGAGEDFLQWEFENGNLGPIEDQWDLAGFDLFSEELVFSGNDDNFENIDFSYSEFWHTKFSNATFSQARFTFARLYNVQFHNCLFSFAHFYGAKLEVPFRKLRLHPREWLFQLRLHQLGIYELLFQQEQVQRLQI